MMCKEKQRKGNYLKKFKNIKGVKVEKNIVFLLSTKNNLKIYYIVYLYYFHVYFRL